MREVKRRPTAPVRWGVRRFMFVAQAVSGVRPRATAITLVLPKKILAR